MPVPPHPSIPKLFERIGYFRTPNLKTTEAAFRARLEEYQAGKVRGAFESEVDDAQMRQMRNFCWGHDHDFGSFQLSGEMGTRHLWMLSRFFDCFGVDAAALDGKAVLDAGCWTGGVSLLLNRFGARVTAIDEVKQYPHVLNYLARSFELQHFETRWQSLYEIQGWRWRERFDAIFCLGVVYHLSDPIVGLRRLFHALKPGGLLCIETMAIDSADCVCEYEGPERMRGKFGWNWFVPSPRALEQWLRDAGFADLQVGDGMTPLSVTSGADPMGVNRCFAVGRKDASHRISRAGLSVDLR